MCNGGRGSTEAMPLVMKSQVTYGKLTKFQRNTREVLKKGEESRVHEQKSRLFINTAAATTAWLEEKIIDA